MPRSARSLLQPVESALAEPANSAKPVLPVLERVARRKLTPEEKAAVLHEIAAAYQEWRRDELEANREVHTLLGEFLTEVRKIDESLKVLGVYLERIRRRLQGAVGSRSLH
jgi:hypothetical protein